ncbi:phosphatidylinositol 4,5-bisphosphate 5-phosphatase A-like [Tubulanus polymorphus]|uniref:phosphatidylinositol 4,5-bisphosphate 5-phosphatase A-like n=1 Tax=Tubulanus polymorphus TaxID=672921 RepID=UPI003DA33A60
MGAKQTKNVAKGTAQQTLKIHTCSWNVANEKPVDNLTEWLGLDCGAKHEPAVIVVGLQEVGDQATWEETLLNVLTERGYARAKHRSMAWLYTAAFVKQRHLAFATNFESETMKIDYGGPLSNKGAVSVRFNFYGVNAIFVNAHFTAHHKNTDDRIGDYGEIVDGQKFRDPSVKLILDHDYVFWFGDLNFRIDDLSKSDIERYIKSKELKALRPHDQLNKARAEKLVFVGFQEGAINFNPTYKFDKGTDTYDTSSKQRKPAWTDRILWKVVENKFNKVKSLLYRSHPGYKTSDHKPISGEFEITAMKNAPELPVIFTPISLPRSGTLASFEVSYHCDARRLETSTRDWLGLYRSDLKHADAYETWVWAETGADDVSVTFTETENLSGKFRVAYFNRVKNCLVGYSNVFEIGPK